MEKGKSTGHIAIIDDEQTLRISVGYALEQEGYAISLYADAESALEDIKPGSHDLLVLDVIMPGKNGYDVCRQIRDEGNEVPVIFLTSRDEEYERVMGLELGGNDYIGKPFSLRELIARVKVQLRGKTIPVSIDDSVLSLGALSAKPDSFRAFWDGKELDLTATEFRIVQTMLAYPERVWTRAKLVETAYPWDVYLSDRSLDSHIKRLRKKIRAAGGDPGVIETVYGVGYRLKA